MTKTTLPKQFALLTNDSTLKRSPDPDTNRSDRLLKVLSLNILEITRNKVMALTKEQIQEEPMRIHSKPTEDEMQKLVEALTLIFNKCLEEGDVLCETS